MRFPHLAATLVVLGIPVLALGRPQPGSSPPPAQNTGVAMRAHQILSGNELGATNPGRRIVRSRTQLEMLLRQVYSGQAPPAAPQVDFSRQVLVYYSLGSGMHGGARVYIRSGSLERGVLHVEVEIASSGGNCLGTNSLTAPFALAALPFPARDVRRADYRVTHKSYPCK